MVVKNCIVCPAFSQSVSTLALSWMFLRVKYQRSHSKLCLICRTSIFFFFLFLFQANYLSVPPSFLYGECIIFSESHLGSQFLHYSMSLPHLEHSCFLDFLTNRNFWTELNWLKSLLNWKIQLFDQSVSVTSHSLLNLPPLGLYDYYKCDNPGSPTTYWKHNVSSWLIIESTVSHGFTRFSLISRKLNCLFNVNQQLYINPLFSLTSFIL